MAVRKRIWTTRLGERKEAWIVDYFDQHGRRHIETFARKRDAVAREPKVKVDIGKGMHVAPSESPTVAEAAQRWLNRVKANEREQSTYNQYERHVRLHIVPHLGSTKLAKLTPAGIEKYRDDYLLAKLSRPLARKVLTSLKSLLKSAKFAHVAADVTMARARRERRLEEGINFPDPRELKRLNAAATTAQQRALLLAAALTGLRASELRGLRWSDVELEIGELQVRKRADQFAKIGEPKSEAGRRHIPLAPELVSALREWKVACPISELELVFPSSDGEIEHHHNMLGVLAALMRAAGVVAPDGKPKYAMHAFRHFFASWSINPKERGGRELPPKVVQALLGHSSIVMTLDVYGHLFRPGRDRTELAEASRQLLGDPPPDSVVVPFAR